MRRRRKKTIASAFPVILILATLTAFAIRMRICHELLSADPAVANPLPATDMATYKKLSEEILAGKFKGEYYYQPFYYAIFLPTVKLIFGKGVWALLAVQCLLSALTVLLTGLAARSIRGPRAGVFAATLAAFSSIMALYVPYFLIATLQTFWMALILYLCVDILAKRRRTTLPSPLWDRCVDWARVGLVLGFAILTRGNAWLLLPGVLLAALVAEHRAPSANRLKKIIPAAVLLAFVIIPQIPFSWRNTAIRGRLSMPSTAAGAVLSLGNTPESPPGGLEYPETFTLWNKDKTPVWRHIVDWALERPASFLELQFRKLLLFWDYREIPNNIAMETQGIASPTLRTTGLIPTAETKSGLRFIPMNLVPSSLITLVLALAGTMFLATRLSLKALKKGFAATCARKTPDLLLLYFLATSWLGVSAFYVLSRFRAPVVPVFCVLAGCFASTIIAAARKRRQKALIFSLVLIPFSLAIVLQGYDTYRFDLEKNVASAIKPDGILVRGEEGQTAILRDNGPRSLGSWIFKKIEKGDTMTKKFVIPKDFSKQSSAAFALEIVWTAPGRLVMAVNGSRKLLKPKNNRPGLTTSNIRIPTPSDGVVSMRILYATPNTAFLALDEQRGYGRTTINGKKMDSELVCRLRLRKAPSDNISKDEHVIGNVDNLEKGEGK